MLPIFLSLLKAFCVFKTLSLVRVREFGLYILPALIKKSKIEIAPNGD